jgi:hypothetical protein
MSGFSGCSGGVCKWDGLNFLQSVAVPSTLMEALDALAKQRLADGAAASRTVVAPVLPSRMATVVVSNPIRTGSGGGGASGASLVLTGGVVLGLGVLIGAALSGGSLNFRLFSSSSSEPKAPLFPPPTTNKDSEFTKTFKDRVKALFKRMDVTTSGKVTYKDMRTLGYKSKDASWILDYIDTNHDGEVTLEEFTSYFTSQEAQIGKEKMISHLAVFETEVEAHIARHRLDKK